jgi:uncharacterized protein (TIGR02271 family)
MNETVVGVFLDESYAQQAIQALQASGYNARIADESAIRSFRNLGWEDEVTSLYEGRYNEGNSIVIVEGADGSAALSTLLQYGAEYINLHGEGAASGAITTTTTQTSGQTSGQYDAGYYRNLAANQRQYGTYDESLGRARNADEMRLQLREETLTPVKQATQAGEVQLRKVVHEREVEVPVTLRLEEVIIERVPVNREATAGEIGNMNDVDMQDQVISVPVYEETVELQKQTRVREEVQIGKRTTEEQETLRGTARSEDVEVDQSGQVRMQGSTDQMSTDTHTHTTTGYDETSYNRSTGGSNNA